MACECFNSVHFIFLSKQLIYWFLLQVFTILFLNVCDRLNSELELPRLQDPSYLACNRCLNVTFLFLRVAHDNKDCEGNELSHEVRTIDAGELVWAVAFGSRHADTKPYSTNLNWYRYRIATDLLLATGLSSGRIRVYQVKTGE